MWAKKIMLFGAFLTITNLQLQVVNHDSSLTMYTPHAAPRIKLVDVKNAMQVNTKIECTTTCNNLLTWRLHSQIDDRNDRNWYEVIATNKSGNLCTETIALTSVWDDQSINAVSVQCIAVSVCPSEAQTSCLQGVCLSNIQGM